LVITRLVCSLVGQVQTIKILPGSLAYQTYGRDSAVEEFRCNYGFNQSYQDKITAGGLKVTGVDANGEARIVELPDHRFYMGTLFLPQLSSSKDHPHPLITAYLKAAATIHAGNDLKLPETQENQP
jgi:CTP synthase (UTP-ammonia lyase)